MKTSKFLVLLLIALVCFSYSSYSQGVTTSAMKGKVVNTSGEDIFTANVLVTHVPTGTQYGTITGEDGRFNIRNMRVGGPYSIKVSFIGYKDEVLNNIYLQLNKTAEFSMTLQESVVTMKEVVVVFDKNDVISSDRTGSMTNINSEQIYAMPTISRSSSDLTRLTPESNGNSFGGRNNLYNNFSLDGSIFNNSFGLDYATPGGQADAQPVSLDAIEQIQVSLAPFDVREGGFTGAGINAVTKSGTNELKGTAYYYYRNQEMIGKKVNGMEYENFNYSFKQYGVSLGGPIIKNKLFFFANYESERRDQLAHGFVANDGTNSANPNTTSINEADIAAVQAHLRDHWGYEPGAYQGYNHETFNNKFILKLDWNITKGHNFTIRYNMLDAWKDILPHPEAVGGRGPTSFRLPFENSSYRINNKIHSVVAELNSIFSNKVANKLLVGYTSFRDTRDPKSLPFPVIDIIGSDGNVGITAGSEMFSTSNVLNQDVFQITDNLTYYLDKHTLTVGFNYEQFIFENSFNLFYYPWVTAFSVEGFLNNDFAYFTGIPDARTGNLNQDVSNSQAVPYLWSSVNVGQFALYFQDEWQATDKLNLTFGIRGDIPIYYNPIENTTGVQEMANFQGWKDENGDAVTINPANWPEAKILWSPRFGFNYDVKGDQTLQVRGGTGIFSGRIPFVWLGNQSSNAGMLPEYAFQVNATASDFRWPQVWKNNLAVDVKFGEGWLVTLEGIVAEDINAVVHRNYNMAPPSGNLTGTGDTRPIFAGFNEVNIYSSTPGGMGFLDAGAIVLDNTDQGHQYIFTAKLAKKWRSGLTANIAYTYTDAKDFTSIPAEIASDAFQRNPVAGNPNMPQFSWSRYGLQHRVIASAMYKIKYGRFATTFGMFYELAKGNRYSYVYAGDLNQDAINNNDLMYIPADINDIVFGTVDENGVGTVAADEGYQRNALELFIEQDPYLSQNRGSIAERNGASLPWFSQMDIKIIQDFELRINEARHKFQFSVDIMNFGNMISSSWGVRQFAATHTPLAVNGVDANSVPYFKFNTNLKNSYIDNVSLASKWQVQIGIRYIF